MQPRSTRDQPCSEASASRSLGKLLQAEADQLRGFCSLAGSMAGRGNRGSRLGLDIAEIDQRGHRIEHRPRRTLLVDRARQVDHRRIEIGVSPVSYIFLL